jgi:hypothetical protein
MTSASSTQTQNLARKRALPAVADHEPTPPRTLTRPRLSNPRVEPTISVWRLEVPLFLERPGRRGEPGCALLGAERAHRRTIGFALRVLSTRDRFCTKHKPVCVRSIVVDRGGDAFRKRVRT